MGRRRLQGATVRASRVRSNSRVRAIKVNLLRRRRPSFSAELPVDPNGPKKLDRRDYAMKAVAYPGSGGVEALVVLRRYITLTPAPVLARPGQAGRPVQSQGSAACRQG